jgi:hypothetical protein
MKNTEERKLTGDPITVTPGENDISPEELELLDQAGEEEEEVELRRAELDNTDADGTVLNEHSSHDAASGIDLDVPGSGDDDDNEEIGEEDEENNSYSLKDGDA